jgi:hypothetical protein
MSGKIFVQREGEKLIPLLQTPYKDEDCFQALIAKHPEILAGDQIDPDKPREWILVSREKKIPFGDAENRLFSLDHLFIDQDAIPTFIEVKRSEDTRTRREWVGQMLDYAANGVQYWTASELREHYDRSVLDEATVTLSEIGITDEDKYWQDVGENLRDGKVRLMFVADEIPSTVQTVFEFLNDKMDDVAVFGLEIKQYLSPDGSTITLVPNLVGRTARTTQTKRTESKGNKRKYANHTEFMESFDEPIIKDLYLSLIKHCDDNGLEKKLEITGYSVKTTNNDGKSIPLFWAVGGGDVWDANTIVIPYSHVKGISDDIVAAYKSEIGKLPSFRAAGNWHKWQMTAKSSEAEMQMFLAVISNISVKIHKESTE